MLALAGCDRLTISPALLAQLAASTEPVPVMLSAAGAAAAPGGLPKVHFDEAAFRWALNEDAMATEKLGERRAAPRAARHCALLPLPPLPQSAASHLRLRTAQPRASAPSRRTLSSARTCSSR